MSCFVFSTFYIKKTKIGPGLKQDSELISKIKAGLNTARLWAYFRYIGNSARAKELTFLPS